MNKKAHKKFHAVFFSYGILEQAGGFENYLMATTQGLAERHKDLDVTIVTMTPRIVEKLQHLYTVYFFRKQDPKAIYRESYDVIMKKLKNVRYVRADSLAELKAILLTADAIYSKNEMLEMTVLNKLGVKQLPPIIIGVHTPIYYPNTPSLSARLHNLVYTGFVYRQLTKRLKLIQVNNHDDLRFVQQKLKFPNVKVIGQAFDIPQLSPRTQHKGKLRIVFVGRLTEAKGISLLTEVIKRLSHDFSGSYEMKIAGSGDVAFVNQIKRLADKTDGVEYLGHVDNEKVTELYDWTDITVITSEYETLNKVAIETAIAGKIAVCTDIPGPREVIVHNKTGYLLPASSEKFIDKIKELAALRQTDPRRYEAIGNAAYDYVNKKFNAEEVYKEMYNDLLSITKEG
jgi:glycosyltransferase involved in cell wall biosynthesis